MPETELEITGVDVARVSDWFRYSLFRVGTWVALSLVAVAVALSFAGQNANVLDTLAAGAILAAPLTIAAIRSWQAWRLVFRHPAILLLVGPLTVLAGILGDRSAFYYPELLCVAGAAIAGGMRWALGAIVMFTLGTTAAGILNGQLNGQQAIAEAALVIGPRVVFAVLMAGLFEGLAQIVWLATAEASHGSAVQVATTTTNADVPTRTTYDEPASDQSEHVEEVLDAILVAESEPARETSLTPASVPRRIPRTLALRKPITDIERAVLEVVAEGMTVAQAAQELGIPARTARARIERALVRNGLHSMPALISWAFENGHLLARLAQDQPAGNDADR